MKGHSVLVTETITFLLFIGIYVIPGIAFYECYLSAEHYCPTDGIDIPAANLFPLIIMATILLLMIVWWGPGMAPEMKK